MSKRLWSIWLGLFVNLSFAHATSLASDNEYTSDASWLCRPGKAGVCANADALGRAIDCFYLTSDAHSIALPTCDAYAPKFKTAVDAGAAWNYYVEHDNQGRGVVLIADQANAAIAMQVLAREIDDKPSQARLISAVMPDSASDMQSLKMIGPCQGSNQIECVATGAQLRELAITPARLIEEQTRAYLAVAAECDCKKQERQAQSADANRKSK